MTCFRLPTERDCRRCATADTYLPASVCPQSSTPISLKATAGLRLLPGDKADNILKAVEALLRKQPFKLAPGGVAIMDGGCGPACDPQQPRWKRLPEG